MFTYKTIFSLLTLFSLSLVGFSQIEIRAKKTSVKVISVKSKLRKGHLLLGDRTEKCYFNNHLIVGIVTKALMKTESIEIILNDLELEWNMDSKKTIQPIRIGRRQDFSFGVLRKKSRQRFTKENCKELELLRNEYLSNFGPGIYHKSGEIWGVLSNTLKVGFKKGMEKEKIEELLQSYGAIRITLRPSQSYDRYIVDFPKHLGYEIIDIGDNLLKLDEVNFVANQYQVINN